MPMTTDLSHDPILGELEDPRQVAYLCALVVSCGHQGRACEAAGISRWVPWRWRTGHAGRPPSAMYLEALRVAEDLAAQRLQDVAIERATVGLRSYKFDKEGKPLRHPRRCECTHDRAEHVKARSADGVTLWGPCAGAECSCEAFEGAPYHESVLSDKLIQFLLRGSMPDRYAERVQVSGSLKTINWDALSATPAGQAAIARMARGEHPYSVLASAAEEGGRLLASGAVLGGPGTEDETSASEGNEGGEESEASSEGWGEDL